MHACRVMNSLALRRHDGMALMTVVLEWKDTGSLGRTVRGGEEGESPSTSMSIWNAWSSDWGWIRELMG